MKLNLDKMMLVTGLIGKVSPPVRIFVTTSNWERIAREIERDYGDCLVTKHGKPNPRNFKEFATSKSVIWVNSGTGDQEVCNILNAPEEARTAFRYRESAYAVRRA